MIRKLNAPYHLKVSFSLSYLVFITFRGLELYSIYVYLRDGEESNPGHQDQSHGVKPTADVGKNPQRKSELD